MVNGQNFYYHNAQNPGSPLKDPVMVFYKFKNDEKAGPGDAAARGQRACLSEGFQGRACSSSAKIASITRRKTKHLNMHIGNAFDVISERKQTDYKQP